jgi:hypothetical protein
MVEMLKAKQIVGVKKLGARWNVQAQVSLPMNSVRPLHNFLLNLLAHLLLRRNSRQSQQSLQRRALLNRALNRKRNNVWDWS